eukprot:5433980-Prymnesium_polylepis.1
MPLCTGVRVEGTVARASTACGRGGLLCAWEYRSPLRALACALPDALFALPGGAGRGAADRTESRHYHVDANFVEYAVHAWRGEGDACFAILNQKLHLNQTFFEEKTLDACP